MNVPRPAPLTLTLTLTLALAPAVAAAQPAVPPWSAVTAPGARAAAVERRAGDWVQYLSALPERLRERVAPERDPARLTLDALTAEALAHFDRALARRPDDPHALSAAAQLRERVGDPAGALRDAARSLEISPAGDDAQDAHFTLAIVYSKESQHAEARDHYLALLRFPLPVHTRAVVLGNLGDEFESLGDLPAAVDSYAASVDLRPERALNWLGLAIARDRSSLDPTADAARAVRAASDFVVGRLNTPRTTAGATPDALLDELGADGVFYVPDYDRHYYEGMAHEAVARAYDPSYPQHLASDDVQMRQHRELAIESWRAYLGRATPDDPWRARAVAHLRALGGVAR